MSINSTNQKDLEVIHPIFNTVKPKDLFKVKQSQNLIIMKMWADGYSYNQISLRLLFEHKIEITSQRVGKIVQRYRDEWRALA